MIAQRVRTYLSNWPSDIYKTQALITLILIKESLPWEYPIDDYVISKLTKDNIIRRNYINRNFELTVNLYESDDELEDIDDNGWNKFNLDNIDTMIDSYRTLFKGYRVGNMGNKKNCIDYMIRFILQHKVSFEEILFATQYYIQNTEMKYITNAENFIYRVTDKGEISKLADIIEELRLVKSESNML